MRVRIRGGQLCVIRDSPLQLRKAGWGDVFARVSAPALCCQERTFQMRPQQAAAALFVQAPGLAQHGECAAQGFDATGDQGWSDGLDTITPQLLEKLQQSGEIVVAEFREGKTEVMSFMENIASWLTIESFRPVRSPSASSKRSTRAS